MKNKKVVLFVSSLGGGGAERVAVNLANSFIKKGVLVTVLYAHEKKGLEYGLSKSINLIKIEASNLLYKIFFVRKFFIENKVTTVINFTDVQNVICFLSALGLNKISIINTVHSDLRARDRLLNIGYKNKLIRYFHKLSCRRAKKVVCVSKASAEDLVEYYSLQNDKVTYIYNPVLNKLPNQIKFKKVNFEGDEPLKMIAIGRLTLAKNYVLLFRFLEKLKNESKKKFLLDIYGTGELEKELKSEVVHRGLTEHISFKGFSSNLTELLKTYDIYLMTSLWEGFGNSLVEALAAGLPVISSNCHSGPAEILNNGHFGKLFVNGSIVSLIKEFNNIPELNVDEISLKKHLNQFTNSCVAEKYIKLLGSLE